MVTDKQVRRLFAMKNKVKYLYQLADTAGMSNKTARKYLKSGVLPSQCRAIHGWPTHPDAFAEDWSWVEACYKELNTVEQGFRHFFRAYYPFRAYRLLPALHFAVLQRHKDSTSCCAHAVKDRHCVQLLLGYSSTICRAYYPEHYTLLTFERYQRFFFIRIGKNFNLFFAQIRRSGDNKLD